MNWIVSYPGYTPCNLSEPSGLKASDNQNHCWIKGMQQVSNWHGNQYHVIVFDITHVGLDSWKTWYHQEFKQLNSGVINLQSEIKCAQQLWIEATLYSYSHAVCTAENMKHFIRIIILPDICIILATFQTLERCIWATGRYCSLWSTRHCNVLSRQNFIFACVINKSSLYIKLSIASLEPRLSIPDFVSQLQFLSKAVWRNLE